MQKMTTEARESHKRHQLPDCLIACVHTHLFNAIFPVLLFMATIFEPLIPLPTNPPSTSYSTRRPNPVPQRRRSTKSASSQPPRQNHTPKPNRTTNRAHQRSQNRIKRRTPEEMPTQSIPLHLPIRCWQAWRREPPHAEM